MSDTEAILQVLKDQREENRQDMHELRGAVVKIADAAAEMGKTMARSEERHSHHEDSVQRMGRTITDHETRIRSNENKLRTNQSSTTAGWKVLTVTGTIALALVTAGIALINLIQ